MHLSRSNPAQWSLEQLETKAHTNRTNCAVAIVAVPALVSFRFGLVLHSFNFDRVISTRRWPNRLYYRSFLSILILNWIVYSRTRTQRERERTFCIYKQESCCIVYASASPNIHLGQFEIDKSFLKCFIFILQKVLNYRRYIRIS